QQLFFFFFQAEDGIRDFHVTGVQTCALPISLRFVPRALSGHVRHPAPAPAYRADAGRGLAEPAGRGAPSLAGPRRPASQRRAVITRTGRATPATTAGPRRTQTALLEPPAGHGCNPRQGRQGA